MRMAVEAAGGTRGRLIDVTLSLRAIPMKESTRRLQNQISTACAPYLARQSCRGKRHLREHEESLLLRLAGTGLWKERDCEINTGGLSRFGPQVMRNTLLLLVYVYLVFLD